MEKPSAYTDDEWARMRSGGVLPPREHLDYTPRTDQVRAVYVLDSESEAATGEAFDRWLVAHDAAVWGQGYEAGYSDGAGAPAHDMGYNRGDTANPYQHAEVVRQENDDDRL
jgi:hypothetical protein